MQVTIARESPASADARALVGELDAELEPLYARENRHGYSVEKLIAEDIAFFVMRLDGEPAGCGGIKLVGDAYGEVKRMYVRPRFRGQGLSRRMLAHLAAHAGEHGIGLLRLETGIHQAPAIALYESAGFVRSLPFGAYREDGISLCYEKKLDAPE